MKIAANPSARAAFAPFLREAPFPVLMTYGMDVFVEDVFVDVVFLEVVLVEVTLDDAVLVEAVLVEVMLTEVTLDHVALVKDVTVDVVRKSDNVDKSADVDVEDDADEEELFVSVFPPQSFGLTVPQTSEP